MKRFTQILPAAILIFAMGCGGNKTKTEPKENQEKKDRFEKMKSFSWLEGKWQMANGDTVSTEIWTLTNDSVLTAVSMDIKAGKDTLRYEDITIEQRGADIFYIPVMKDQNDGKPVLFKLASLNESKTSKNSFVFENPEHDFPKKIMYELRGDTVWASISGPMEGNEVVMNFPMVKTK